MTNTFRPLTLDLAPYFETALADMPAKLRKRVTKTPLVHWDVFGPGQRRSVANQWDSDHDPATEAERDRNFNLSCEKFDNLREIRELQLAQAPTVEGLESRRTRVGALMLRNTEIENELESSFLNAPTHATPEKYAALEKEGAVPKPGISTKQANDAFGGLVTINLGAALANGPRWIQDARLSRGTPGGKHAAMWSPVLLAHLLYEKKRVPKSKINQVFYANDFLRDWLDDWRETAKDLV